MKIIMEGVFEVILIVVGLVMLIKEPTANQNYYIYWAAIYLGVVLRGLLSELIEVTKGKNKNG
jgi:hypothetical protein